MFTPTSVVAKWWLFWKKRNKRNKAAHCSRYLAANVPPFPSKRGQLIMMNNNTSSANCETDDLRCRWRSLVSWGSSAWPFGRHRPNLRPPVGESETSERRTFLLWLRPHWKKPPKQSKLPWFSPISDQKVTLILTRLWRSYSSWTTVGPSFVALSSFTRLRSSKVLLMGLSGFGQRGAR